MTKKNDKMLCWNCEGGVSLHHAQCPYCGVDLTHAAEQKEQNAPRKELGDPFQSSFQNNDTIPQPPYASFFNQDFAVSNEEWNQALGDEKETEEEDMKEAKGDLASLFLLLPGIVFLLFSLVLFFFSTDGILTLQWNQSFAYFYFLGAIPFLYLGWRSLR